MDAKPYLHVGGKTYLNCEAKAVNTKFMVSYLAIKLISRRLYVICYI